ncbi:SUMF1/EgtB/PvdO family nonheme iron enzyme [Sedimentisphaera salicampi]|uniref:Uncharacterized protein n=1 Tax=Sedimentisphaera salicampi TaxID=1941349 RepID=A0A1W6LMD3_9BACT|nr:SUMF1/EgtB/PvdO family nonheme iron enzyme [Sedimentisphaera salicampi]ARN56904.1 hypothetical protein STSP1_01297 [Sedimentisphaera salicampi]
MKRAVFYLAVCTILASASFAVYQENFGNGSNQFTISFVDISGDASSANGTNIGEGKTFSDPGYQYRMGTREITNAQWDKFKADYGQVTGDPSSAYDSDPEMGTNAPTGRVSWYEAAQFVNYLNTSKGHQAAYKFTGTQGTSNYALDTWSTAEAAGGTNLYRHKDAQFFLPTEDEWVKAAYWNGSSIQTYATKDGSVPEAGVDTNYNDANPDTWDAGSGAEELNGTYDMMGNVFEWMESPFSDQNTAADSERVYRGGSYYNGADVLASSDRRDMSPYGEYGDIGFRVGTVPEPATMALLGIGGLFIRRRRAR